MEEDKMKKSNIKKKLAARIAVDPVSKCFNWTGPISKGYAIICIEGKVFRAARLSYLVNRGAIPEGKIIHHTCENKKCLNPAHLKRMGPGAHLRLHAKTGIFNGEKNGWARRTNTEVQVIKILNSYFALPGAMIAKAMKIPVRSIYSILSGEVWNHIQI
jgi:hypothetical protein